MKQNFTTKFPRRACAIGVIAILLAACGDGDSDDPASNDPNPTPTQNAPSIGGAPRTTAVPGEMYEFVALASDPDGDTLTFSVQNKPVWATLNANSGRLAGMPSASDVGTTNGIVLSVTDGHSTASLPAFSILVNTAPEISGTPSGTAQVGVNYSFTPTGSDADGDTLIFSVNNRPPWANFDPASGAMTGVPGDDDAGTFSGITIMVSDGNATAALGPFEVTVAPAGSPSALEISATLPATYVWDTLEELKPVYIDRQYTFATIPAAYAGLDYLITANDDKLETANPFIGFEVNRPVRVYVAYDARSTDLPSWLDNWTSTGDVWASTDTTFNVYAREFDAGVIGLGGNEGGQSMYSVAVASLDSPTLSANDDIAETQQDTPVSIDVLSNDSGLDNTPLQLAIVSAASNGTANATPFSTVYYIPASGFSGSDSFDYSVTDASGNSASATVTVIVTAVSGNSQPTAFNDSYNMQQDAVLTMNVLDNDTGLFDAPVVVSVETATGHGTVTIVSGNAIEFRPDDGYSGPDSFTYRVTDVDGDFDTAQVGITVQALNRAPTISGIPGTAVVVGASYSFVPTATDVDGDPLSFSIVNKPGWAIFNPNTGALTGSPDNADVGTTDNILISVSDGEESAALPLFSITVQALNRAPTISGIPGTAVVVGASYSFVPTATDVDGDPLSFSIVNKPGWAIFNPNTGALTGSPDNADVGTTDNILISVSDGEESAALPLFSITVVPASSGSATLSWTPPTLSADGSPLNDLAGYWIYYGTSPGNYTNEIRVANPGLATYVVDNLTPATYYFVITAYDTSDNESDYSNVAIKTIGGAGDGGEGLYAPDNGPTHEGGVIVNVCSEAEILSAIANASAGDVITVCPGTFDFNQFISVQNDGTESARIFLRAEVPGTVTFNLSHPENFKIKAKFWIFENIVFFGDCDTGNSCEHAFHIVADADDVIFRGNEVVNFSAHVKLNGEVVGTGPAKMFPDRIMFINNFWHNTKYVTNNAPHYVLNLDGGKDHVVRGNIFADYSAPASLPLAASAIYPKASALRILIEQNLIVCEKVRTSGETTRGIELGDGAPASICDGDDDQDGLGDCVENGQNQEAIVRNNIIMNCDNGGSSAGIIVSSDRESRIYHNTVYNTGQRHAGFYKGHADYDTYWRYSILENGIDTNYARRALNEANNIMPSFSEMNSFFTAPIDGDFSVAQATSILEQGPTDVAVLYDFCGYPRGQTADLGAIEYSTDYGGTACATIVKAMYDRIP